MTRLSVKQKAIALRMAGHSYSQIKSSLGVSKSTLSVWLRDMPFSENRIAELKDQKEQRIERYRNTMREKRQKRLEEIYSYASKDINLLTDREIFIAGLFLFWGEGSKTHDSVTALTNTDPSMLIFFLKWLELVGIKKELIKARLHLYTDMDIEDTIDFWSKMLNLPKANFLKPYIKKSNLKDLSYKNGFGRGTCMILVANRVLNDYILMAIRRIREIYSS